MRNAGTCLSFFLATATLFPITAVYATEFYQDEAIYVGGDQVCYQQDLYQAKWWAGPDDHPRDVETVDHPWETPWSLIEEDAPSCEETNQGNHSPVALISTITTEVIGEGSLVLSAANSSDPDGDLLQFQWRQVSPANPLAEIDDQTISEPTISFPAINIETRYVFELRVTDGELTDTESIIITQRIQSDTDETCDSWQPAVVYVEGDIVAYDRKIWRAHWWTKGETPGTTGEWGVWRAANDDADCSTGPGADPDPDSNPDDPSTVTLSELLAAEAELTSDDLLTGVKASIRTLDNALVVSIAPRVSTNPENVQRVEQIISEPGWNELFPRRAPEYTYVNFLKAIAKFPTFCGDYADGRDADAICRKALTTMFAHFTQETGGHNPYWEEPEWRQGLVYLREVGWTEDMPNGYGLCDPSIWQGQTFPCSTFESGHPNAGQFKSYFGRGAKQLSYNYNYGPFSLAMFGDVATLLNQPNLVADTWLNLASAVFFYVYPQPPKPSMLHALDGTWQPNQHDLDSGLTPGFGVTTQIINGGIECGGEAEHVQSQNRIDYYLNFANELNVPVEPNEVLGCAGMQRFDTQGSGALPIYWEQNWNQANACVRVNYQTPFSALIEGDYVKCVEHYFDVVIDYEK